MVFRCMLKKASKLASKQRISSHNLAGCPEAPSLLPLLVISIIRRSIL